MAASTQTILQSLQSTLQGDGPSVSQYLPYVESALSANEKAFEPATARPLSEWSEEDGDVLWWKFPVAEAPYVGSPLNLGRNIRVTVDDETKIFTVGGWPGYHTHWTALPLVPVEPKRDGGAR